MELLQTMIIAETVSARHARSALPDAPVIPDRAPRRREPHAVRTRLVLAAWLERAARAVEPAPACRPAR